MSAKDKWVRRFAVDETARHKNGFTIYKITSVLFPLESPEAVTVVSVWKRYSEVQRLHRSMIALHAGLHLRGSCPLPKFSYFRRFQKEVIEERAKAIKRFLEFIAEHRLLFISTEFVNFLQSGYPEPSAAHRVDSGALASETQSRDETDLAAIPQIPIHEPSHTEPRISRAASLQSLTSIDSLNELYDELNKLTVKKTLPDLITFDASIDDCHMSSSNSASSRQSVLSLSAAGGKTRTEDSYVFEAGCLLNMAVRCEDARDYRRAFEFYKSGIEKMLVGVQTDTDAQRRALIKDKTNKYLSYAEEIYKNHLCDAGESLLPEPTPRLHCPVPVSMLKRPYEDLALYRVLAILADSMMLVLHKGEQACYAMKVLQKIPNNLTEFDEYFLRRTNETRQPILPTSIPYMVTLHAYVETNSLIFLILTYAPGEKLLDYIKNYVRSAPNTPAREVNLENVFCDPKERVVGEKHGNATGVSEVKHGNATGVSEVTHGNATGVSEVTHGNATGVSEVTHGNATGVSGVKHGNATGVSGVTHGNATGVSEVKHGNATGVSEVKHGNATGVSEVKRDTSGNATSEYEELVRNSQRLLQDVERALKETRGGRERETREEGGSAEPADCRLTPPRGNLLPPSAICGWGAQILTALESLHNAGVVCRDLNPSNILLSDNGRVILTYFVGYEPSVCLSALRRAAPWAAPELCGAALSAGVECDYWSFGAIMYQLICGVPLSYYHKSVFTSHTILTLPEGLSVEAESLLTQLLTFDPTERLGHNGIDEIKNHPYFKHVDWQNVYDSWVMPG